MHASRRIALFGGTFDPVHLGHIHLAESARNALSLDEVRFLPCRISPHKLDTAPTAADYRLEMLRLATAALTWAVVDDFELQSEGPSFSYQTAEAMKERYPEARLFWIMGTDQWDVLPDWRHSERLAACVEFIVFTRGANPQPRDGYTMHTIEEIHPASATEIRYAIHSGETHHAWLAPAVAEFICQRGLYKDW
jgi:nicotinate-nucleotide adenylyltransferase